MKDLISGSSPPETMALQDGLEGVLVIVLSYIQLEMVGTITHSLFRPEGALTEVLFFTISSVQGITILQWLLSSAMTPDALLKPYKA